ncbi:MAG: molecular chaperone HtpG [Candidatus Promineifilaceae bacterium]|nr:molecular chaperone HtpG [Candidatus Promineifilaceae bacterium]
MTTKEKTASDSYRFQAEIRQLLNILVHSLYQDREIFLRELISNASDALTRMHFEMLTEHDVRDPELELAIYLEVEERDEEKWLIVRDTGVGMTREELVENLGTIAQSGARAFLEQVKEGEKRPSDIIGQFGVGFYSVFMVAEEVSVVSLSYRPDAEAAAWISSGDDQFRVEPAAKEERGTEIHIKLKQDGADAEASDDVGDDATEFASEWRLREIVKRYSDFVTYPIYLDDEQINQQESLWRKSPSEVEEEAYDDFYQQMTMDFQEPLATIHLHSDAPVHVRALLFVPASRDRGVLAARKEPGVKLYSHNVLIQEFNTDLLPKWLSFVDGVVDSEDLPLNISRETVQSNRFMRALARILRKRVVRTLEEMAEEEEEKYTRFWNAHKRTIKEGLATEPSDVNDVLPLLRFHSSKSKEKLTSLDAYVERMPEEQKAIYYVLGDDVGSVARSPHLDPFRDRDLEVLYWVDPLDPFIAPLVNKYKEKPLKNVDDADLELPEMEAEEAEGEGEAPTAPPIEGADFNRLVGRFVTTLDERVLEVRESKVLRHSPVRLVSPQDAADREFQRIYRYLDQEYEIPKKILEVNRRHPLIANLATLVTAEPDAPVIDLTIEQLFDSALVQEGLHPNPAEMLPRIERLMEIAAGEQAPAVAAEEEE